MKKKGLDSYSVLDSRLSIVLLEPREDRTPSVSVRSHWPMERQALTEPPAPQAERHHVVKQLVGMMAQIDGHDVTVKGELPTEHLLQSVAKHATIISNGLALFQVWDQDHNCRLTLHEVSEGLKTACYKLQRLSVDPDRIYEAFEDVVGKKMKSSTGRRLSSAATWDISNDQFPALFDRMHLAVSDVEKPDPELDKGSARFLAAAVAAYELAHVGREHLVDGLVLPDPKAKTDPRTVCAHKLFPAHCIVHTVLAVVLLLAVFILVGGGTLWYALTEGWEWNFSFFYAVRAGLAVGFTTFVTPSESSAGFGIVFTVASTLVVAGALALYLSVALAARDAVRRDAVSRAYGLDGAERGHIDAIDAEVAKTKRALMYAKDHCVGHAGERLAIVVLAIVCLVIGTLWGLVEEKWTFLQSLYFAISAMSTSGVKTPVASSSSLWFAGFFCTLAVPVYAAFVALVAIVVASTVEQCRLKHVLGKARVELDFKIAAGLAGAKDADATAAGLDKADFMRLELLRCGVANVSTLRAIDDRFDRLDSDKSGAIDLTDVLSYVLFCGLDTDSSGLVSAKEWRTGLAKLVEWDIAPDGLSPDAVNALFNAVDVSGDGMIDVDEFRAVVQRSRNASSNAPVANVISPLAGLHQASRSAEQENADASLLVADDAPAFIPSEAAAPAADTTAHDLAAVVAAPEERALAAVAAPSRSSHRSEMRKIRRESMKQEQQAAKEAEAQAAKEAEALGAEPEEREVAAPALTGIEIRKIRRASMRQER